eukprot:jgi/Picsp_1/3737/NSC_06573-R1_---NA---
MLSKVFPVSHRPVHCKSKVTCRTVGRPSFSSKCENREVKAGARTHGSPEGWSRELFGLAASFLLVVSPALTANAMDDQLGRNGPMQSIDIVSDANVGDMINEIESAEIPLLQEDMAKLKASDATEGVEKELQVIEQEAATLAEKEVQGMERDELARETGGILDQLNALKSMMRSLQ